VKNMADEKQDPRKARLVELSKNRANLVEPERSEFDALSREFPETAQTFQEEDAKKEAQAAEQAKQGGAAQAKQGSTQATPSRPSGQPTGGQATGKRTA
jgi:Skp family chaperone for outer membrane proteins